MTCRVWLELIHDRLDGGPADALAEHARACPECAAWAADAERLLAGLDGLPAERPPADLAGRIVASVVADGRKRRRERLRRWAAPAALAAAAAVLLALSPRLWRPTPTPPEEPRETAVALRESVGRAVTSLTARTAQETAKLLPPVAVPPIEPPPTLEPIREAGERVTSGLEPIAGSARRAVNLFFRDLPLARPARSVPATDNPG